jgi:hypothetical protein
MRRVRRPGACGRWHESNKPRMGRWDSFGCHGLQVLNRRLALNVTFHLRVRLYCPVALPGVWRRAVSVRCAWKPRRRYLKKGDAEGESAWGIDGVPGRSELIFELIFELIREATWSQTRKSFSIS